MMRLESYAPESCLTSEQHLVPAARFPAVDVHNHLGRWLSDGQAWMTPDVDGLLKAMTTLNIASVVNLDGRWGAELELNLDRYDRQFPGRFTTFCHVDWRLLRRRGGDRQLVSSVEASAVAGAAGIKVWKDLGLRVRDRRGHLVLPDDERLSDVWDTAGKLGLPVLIHCADPVAFFRPVDRRNERLEELSAHPDWSFHNRGLPSFERLLASQETLIARHPKTTFIGAHVGAWPENLKWVTRLLDQYPNYFVDISQRIAELGRQPRAAQSFFERHANRILFGTDLNLCAVEDIQVYYRLLETADEDFPYSSLAIPPQGRWAISGLDLPEPTLRLVYADNARNIISGLGAGG
jgi:Amidohydrolase